MMFKKSHFKIEPFSLRILLFVVATILIGGCSDRTEQEEFDLAVDKQTSQVTLHATQIPLSTILQRFEQDHQIKIVVPNFQDRKVSIAVDDEPLSSVIKQILAEGERYWIVTETDDLDIMGSTGEKVGKKYKASEELPKKDGATEFLILPDGRFKIAPDTVTSIVSQGDQRTKKKPDPDQVIVGKGPQDSGKPSIARPAGKYLRLRFRVKDEKFTLEKTIVLSGPYIPSEFIQGKYIFSVTSGGRVLAVGSFRDPLEIHSYSPDPNQPHKVVQSETATVDVDLPEIVLREEHIQKFQVQIFTLLAPPPSQELTPKSFQQFERFIERMDAFPNKDIYDKLKFHLEGASEEGQ